MTIEGKSPLGINFDLPTPAISCFIYNKKGAFLFYFKLKINFISPQLFVPTEGKSYLVMFLTLYVLSLLP